MTGSRVGRFGAGVFVVVMLVACRDKQNVTPTKADAALPTATPSTKPSASASPSARITPPPSAAPHVSPLQDARITTACKALFGPAQQNVTGPATLVVSSRGLEIVQHRGGIAVTKAMPIAAPGGAPATRAVLEQEPQDRASRPTCAAAGKFSYCADPRGVVHKSLREMASDEHLTHALPGARITAASLGGEHVVVGTIASRLGAEGQMFEAWAKLDGEPPVRISEEGAGASDVTFAAHKPGEVLALMIDARASMTPVHVRELKLTGNKLEVGPDRVVHVAGGSSGILHGAIATNDHGAAVALVGASHETDFGMLAVPIDAQTKEDAPFAFSPYPNGLDGAPLSGTTGGKAMYVARVRPSMAPGKPPPSDGGPVPPPLVLELGKVDAKGKFDSLGTVPSVGAVSHVSAALDGFGTLWLHYTDQAGSWLERRSCP